MGTQRRIIYEYTEPNLQKLSKLFIAQGQYPELFNGNDIFFGADPYVVTYDNSRFLHINRYDDSTGNIDTKLGYDNYEDKGQNRNSMPLFFYYDKTYDVENPQVYDIFFEAMLIINKNVKQANGSEETTI